MHFDCCAETITIANFKILERDTYLQDVKQDLFLMQGTLQIHGHLLLLLVSLRAHLGLETATLLHE